MRHPWAATDNRGWRIHRGFCDVCDEGLQARRHSIAEAAHMPQNGMYAPPTQTQSPPEKGSMVGQALPLLHSILRVSSVTPGKQGEYFVSHASRASHSSYLYLLG